MKNRVRKLKTNYLFCKNNLNQSRFLLNFLILIIGILVALFSNQKFNFWTNIDSILNNTIFNICLFLAIVINVINYTKDLMQNYNILTRYTSISEVISDFKNKVILSTIFLLLMAFILILAGSFLMALGNFELMTHDIYEIPLIMYNFLSIIKIFVFHNILAMIFFYIYFLFKEKIVTGIIAVFVASFFLFPKKGQLINHLYHIPFWVTKYFEKVNFSNIFLEISAIMIQGVILYLIAKCLSMYLLKRKESLDEISI